MEAARIHRETLQARRSILGNKHPDTRVSSNNLAYVVKKQGNFVEALKILRETLEWLEEAFGPQDPNAKVTASNLCEVTREHEKKDARAKAKQKEQEEKAERERKREEDVEKALELGNCSICLDADTTWVFEDCGHKCVCKACGRKQKEWAQAAGGSPWKKMDGRRKALLVHCPLCRKEANVVPTLRRSGECYE